MKYLPILILIAALPIIGYAWRDILNRPTVRYLPKWAWMILCLNLVGVAFYFTFGREAKK
jgi:hypothetical protein